MKFTLQPYSQRSRNLPKPGIGSARKGRQSKRRGQAWYSTRAKHRGICVISQFDFNFATNWKILAGTNVTGGSELDKCIL